MIFCRTLASANVAAVLLIAATGFSQNVPPDPHGKNATIVTQLDVDGNGRYDDAERKSVLDLLQKECPQIQGRFDLNGDGKVTVEEQYKDRGPISLRDPACILNAKDKILWTIDLFPEWISTAFFQEDAAEGTVESQLPYGIVQTKATQPEPARQPVKANARNGVEFSANSGQYLSMPGYHEALWDYRWALFTFRIDAHSGADQQTVLLDINHGNDPGKSSPKIWYDKLDGLKIQYVGLNKGGADKRIMIGKNVVADGKTWNIVVCGIRYGKMFASVNGVPLTTSTEQPPRYSTVEAENATSSIGDPQKGNMAWAYDAIVFGMTEPDEEMVRKLTGWAAYRLGIQSQLPLDHPYRSRPPVLDAEDFPDRFIPNRQQWDAWGHSLNPKTVRANAGGPRMEPQGFERVFYDDFRAYRADSSTSGEGDLWMGPGYNHSVGVAAALIPPGQQPNAYPYDSTNHIQSLSLAQQDNGAWRGSALYSVNDMGYGYDWKGPKVFRIRCMLPKIDPQHVTPTLFPAYWSYGTENLFWRTSNRIEIDWYEGTGRDPYWLNGMSTHLHYPYLRNSANIFAQDSRSNVHYKVYGSDLTEEKSRIPGGIYFWDGQFHTWEYVVDEDTTYVNVTISDGHGKEKWVEVYRFPTSPLHLERLDFQLDYALMSTKGMPPEYASQGADNKPPNGQRQNFLVKWIEVLQKTKDVEHVPAPFIARPTLSGSTTVGSTITCHPNVKGTKDVRYYWFADGYPLTYGTNDSYSITDAYAGKSIRCMVKAVGARNMPEAWSKPML